MAKKVLVPIADGTEEIEAVTIIDVLRRAGAEVIVASVDEIKIKASRGVRIEADCLISECRDGNFDLVVLPGGMPGAEHLRDNAILKRILLRQNAEGKLYGGICAAPAVVLETHGLLQDRLATCHPGHVRSLANTSAVDQRVVVNANCVTSRGPGTAMEFSLELVALLFGKDKMTAVAGPLVMANESRINLT